MNKCSPVEMRKNLEIARRYSEIGLDFVCVPVTSDVNKNTVQTMANENLEEILKEAEAVNHD